MTLQPPRRAEDSSYLQPDTWTIGYTEDGPDGNKVVGERPISDEIYAEYAAAVRFILAQQAQTSLRLVIGNYTEFRALQTSMSIAFTTAQQANWPDAAQSQFHLRRILLNLLNSIRLFDDHNRARIVRSYGDPSIELNSYMMARSTIYDEVPSYRFLFELRNYAQHCGEVPVQAEIHIDAAASKLDLYFSRDELLREFKKWKQVKSDLQAGPGRIGLDLPIEGAMAAVTRLAKSVAEIEAPKISALIERVRDILGPPPENPDRRTTIFRTRFVTDDSGTQVMKMDVAPVLLIQSTIVDQQSSVIELPDFSTHRPSMSTKKSTRRCQGPINKVTQLPAETCSDVAKMSFCFPPQEGIAFIFACEGHALSLG